ncbi:pirin family protein [Pseudomonas sp. JQ170]|uniref:pirin family protein n=1 Tax=unclassified Pseudomonas TaxID=196821 RepID=UPI00264A90B5|nr:MULTISPECIES: pirin family protein [unclassified Pseudomonas]MDN7143664.1 pirin family protein [Pseudomonas sp. JQ170]WRO74168.1 pirin family protein [Pseudomonas sp. 170C]
MKKILGVYTSPRPHWVGDGFPVRTLFSYDSLGEHISPFLLLDFAGPQDFPPTTERRGVGEHPHRGFETVTIVYQGELEHRDSTGAGGRIGPGDVQWMTAAAGIVHEELHSEAFARSGGTLEMVQLWVNLPARDKMSAPRYQTILDQTIPVISLTGGSTLRLIAGTFKSQIGPAKTFSPIDVWDLQLKREKPVSIPLVMGRTTLLVVLRGTVLVNSTQLVREAQTVVFDQTGNEIQLEGNNEARVMLLCGEPLNEPIVGYGPFVMNTDAEIRQAVEDFQNGQFGQMSN